MDAATAACSLAAGAKRTPLVIPEKLLDDLSSRECKSVPKPMHIDPLEELVLEVDDAATKTKVFWNKAHKFFVVVKGKQMFVGFYGNCFSNWADLAAEAQTVSVTGTVKTIRFNSTEAIFKTCCFLLHRDLDLCADEICVKAMDAPTLADVKSSTKAIKNFNSKEWDARSFEYMLYCTGHRLKSQPIFEYVRALQSMAAKNDIPAESIFFAECTEKVSMLLYAAYVDFHLTAFTMLLPGWHVGHQNDHAGDGRQLRQGRPRS
jgi:hypothetical protein